MSNAVREKSARFFRAYILDNGTRVDVEQVDWQAVLTAVGKLAKTDRTTGDGLRFEAFPVGEQHLLGMHKPLDPNFLSREDPDTQSIVDVMSSEEASESDREAEKLFRSTGVIFFEVGNAFALTQGSVGAMKQGAVKDFMQLYAPPGPGRHWGVEPLIDDSQLAEFKGAKRAKSIESVIDSRRQLLDAEGQISAQARGPATLPDHFAEAIGGDVKVTMKIELLPQSQSIKTQQRMYDSIRTDVARLIAPGAKTKVTTVTNDGTNEVLELAEHNLASTFEVDARNSEVIQFSTLMARLSDVRAEMQDRVRAIIEGVGDVGPSEPS